MFKNLTVYRMGPDALAPLAQVEEALEAARFAPCGATQQQSIGWVSPRGTAHGVLVESVGAQWLLRLQIEQRIVPGSVVKRRTEEMAEHIEKTTGRKPGRKETKELKEQALLELLPMAFTKQSAVQVWLNPADRLLMLDTTSSTKADAVITLLVKSVPGLAVNLLHTEATPVALMSQWLAGDEPPAHFSVDRECELKSSDEMKSVVRYARHPLDIEEVRLHISQGKLPTRLAMTWEGRVAFVLTDAMHLKKIEFLDGVFEGQPRDKVSKEEAFDADAAIATGELRKLLPDLIEVLGGEHVLAG